MREQDRAWLKVDVADTTCKRGFAYGLSATLLARM